MNGSIVVVWSGRTYSEPPKLLAPVGGEMEKPTEKRFPVRGFCLRMYLAKMFRSPSAVEVGVAKSLGEVEFAVRVFRGKRNPMEPRPWSNDFSNPKMLRYAWIPTTGDWKKRFAAAFRFSK